MYFFGIGVTIRTPQEIPCLLCTECFSCRSYVYMICNNANLSMTIHEPSLIYSEWGKAFMKHVSHTLRSCCHEIVILLRTFSPLLENNNTLKFNTNKFS